MSKERIISLLKSTERAGIDNLINYLETSGFFTAPCSTQYHLAKEGGLTEHSLNVYNAMVRFYNNQSDFTSAESTIILVSLLHDIGKAGQFGKPGYVENILKSGKRSDSKPYDTNSDLTYIPHEVRGLQIISKYIDLTEEESFAILQHNGMYGDLKYSLQGKEKPLQLLLHFADMWASRVLEMEEK